MSFCGWSVHRLLGTPLCTQLGGGGWSCDTVGRSQGRDLWPTREQPQWPRVQLSNDNHPTHSFAQAHAQEPPPTLNKMVLLTMSSYPSVSCNPRINHQSNGNGAFDSSYIFLSWLIHGYEMVYNQRQALNDNSERALAITEYEASSMIMSNNNLWSIFFNYLDGY